MAAVRVDLKVNWLLVFASVDCWAGQKVDLMDARRADTKV